MTWAMLRAIAILPGTALLFVPALLLWATGGFGTGATLATRGEPMIASVLAMLGRSALSMAR